MTIDTIDYMNREGLKFFGKVNASISHELKNILAIISETAGFLNDLTELAKQGKNIELSLLESCNDSIAEEVGRGFGTIKQMNRFAHSVDVPVTNSHIPEILDLTVNLCGYLSFSGSVNLDLPDAELKPVLSSPFLLQNLFYKVLCWAFEQAGPDGAVTIRCRPKDTEGIAVVFSGQPRLGLDATAETILKEAAGAIGATLGMETGSGEIIVVVPYAVSCTEVLTTD